MTDLPQDSAYSAHDWRYAVSRRSNDHGVHIADAFSVDLFNDLRNGGSSWFGIAGFGPGHDDLVARGNGVVDTPAKAYLNYEHFRPRKGAWSFYGNLQYAGRRDRDDVVATDYSFEIDFKMVGESDPRNSGENGLVPLERVAWAVRRRPGRRWRSQSGTKVSRFW